MITMLLSSICPCINCQCYNGLLQYVVNFISNVLSYGQLFGNGIMNCDFI